MAVSTTTLEKSYSGNNSTVTPYPIPFPFLDADHIFAAVSPDGVADPVLLAKSAYVVTPLANGLGGSLVTTAPLGASAKIVIFREVPLTQPVTFQATGPFPAKTNEIALDRLLMQVQQLARRIAALSDEEGSGVGVGGDGVQGVAVWADPANRSVTKPDYVGQLGVERSSQSVWIAQTTLVGGWQEYGPRRKARVTLGFLADGATNGPDQADAAEMLDAWNVDGVIFTGGVNPGMFSADYQSLTHYEPDYAGFTSRIVALKAFPALGQHDLDGADWPARHAARFSYLPGNKRYYTVTLGGGLLDLFVLNAGFNSNGEVVEPDGNTVGSVQHQWFVSALANSQARWKVAVFDAPPVSLATAYGITATEMDWPELAQVDLICASRSHLLEMIRWKDTMLVNASAMTFDDGVAGGDVVGAAATTDRALWANDEYRGLGRIIATSERLEVEVWRLDGALLHARDVHDFTPQPEVCEQFAVVETGTPVGELDEHYIGALVAPTLIKRVMVTVGEAGAEPLAWTLYAGEVQIATGVVAENTTLSLATSLVPLSMIARGAQLFITTEAVEDHDTPDATGLRVAIFAERYSGVALGAVVSLPGASPAPALSVPGKYRFKGNGTFQLWNADQEKFHTLTISGAAGAESIGVEAGEA